MQKRSADPTGNLFPEEFEFDPLAFEKDAFRSGFSMIAGIDEAGRGPLAGPVVAAAVVLPKNCYIPHLTDSKKLTARQREALFSEIHKKALCIGVGLSDPLLIDRINILEATRLAMKNAVHDMEQSPDYLLIDALCIDLPIPQRKIIKGDLKSHSISAASVIAKVTRDRLMEEYHSQYPVYNFKKHKGYGTQEHRDKIRAFGPSPIHRKTFRCVREYCMETGDED